MEKYIYDFEKRAKVENEKKLTACELIEAYISDDKSYDLDDFCFRNRITRQNFSAKIHNARNYHKEAYEKYLKAYEENKKKYFDILMENINELAYGVIEGLTIDGRNFDIYEFYKLLPFIGSDFYMEMRYLAKDYPELQGFSKVRQEYCLANNKTKYSPCTYADNLYIFIKTIRPEFADIIKKYMDENNISRVNPIHRESFKNGCNNLNNEITREECEEIFDYMDQMGYPCILEVYYRLKEEKLKSRVRK